MLITSFPQEYSCCCISKFLKVTLLSVCILIETSRLDLVSHLSGFRSVCVGVHSTAGFGLLVPSLFCVCICVCVLVCLCVYVCVFRTAGSKSLCCQY